MLRTRPIKAERLPDDGIRISVMSRHTLADGVTPDTEISDDSYDFWWPELAPPPKLIGAYYKRSMRWDEFEGIYLQHLRDPSIQTRVYELANLAGLYVVTALCVEDRPDRCHRRLLAQECQLLQPGLQVEIN